MEFFKGYMFVPHICYTYSWHGKNNFAKVSKNLARSKNNFVKPSK